MTCLSDYFPESRPTGWLSDAKREGMPNRTWESLRQNRKAQRLTGAII